MQTILGTPTLDEVKAHRAMMAARADLRRAAAALNAATVHNAGLPAQLAERVAVVNAAHLNLVAAAEAYAQARA